MKFNIKLLPLLCLLSLPSIADDANDYFEKALSSNRLGNVDEAYIYLKNALQQEPEHLPARILMGELYFKKGDMFSTEEVLSDALNNGADINLLIYYLGYSLLAQSKIEQLLLLEKHERSLTFDNKFEWTLLKAQAYEKLDNILYAQGFYDEAIRLKPTAFKAYNAYASLLIKESELEKAKSLIDQSFKLESNNAKTLSLLAEWHLKQSQIEPAIEALNKAFVFSPDDPKIMRLLAFTYMRVGNFEQAKTYLNIISDKYPQDASATLMQAWLLANKDQSSLAQESLDNLDMRLTLFTDDQLIENQTINYLKGSSEFIKGNYESAQQSLLSFLAENPSHYSSIQMLTQIYKELDGDDAATKFLDSKRYAIIGHLPLSIQLVESYVNSGKLFAAREFLGLLREEHAENTYINYINGLVDKARGLNASALEFVNRIPEQEQQQFDILLLKAELLIELDKFSDANTILQELNNQNPENVKVVNLRGSLALKMNDFALSEQLFKQILTQQNDNYLAKYNLAISMVKQNKINQAIQQLKQTVTLNEDHAPSRVMLSKYLFLRGDVDEAQQHAEYLSRRDESYVQGHELLSRIYMKKLQWLDAFNSTSTLLQDDNLNPSYLADHIRVLNGLDRRQETTRYLSILGSLWGDSWQNLIQLAQLHELVAQKDKAAEVLEKAIELKPNSSRPYLYLTQVYIALSQHSKANSVLKNTEKLFGRSDVSVTLKGDIANAENKTKTALKFYNQALKLNPASDIALVKLYQLAKSNVGANKFSQLMLKRLKSDTSKPWHRKLLADHYLNHGQNDKAIREYQTLLAIPGLDKDISILNNLANLHVPNQLEMALDYAFRAYQIDNKNPVILDTYGWVLVQLDKKQEALAVLRNAASMDALNPEINYHLGVLLAQMGRVDDAKFELNKALETKAFPYRKEVQALLETL